MQADGLPSAVHDDRYIAPQLGQVPLPVQLPVILRVAWELLMEGGLPPDRYDRLRIDEAITIVLSLLPRREANSGGEDKGEGQEKICQLLLHRS